MDLMNECLGCKGRPDFFFVLRLYLARDSDQKARSIIHGMCFTCATPGSRSYEQFSKRLACLMFMEKNKLQGIAPAPAPANEGPRAIVESDSKDGSAKFDYKTLASGDSER